MSKGKRIKKLLFAGKSYDEIQEEVGCAKSTITYHKKKLGLPIESKYALTYDWEEVQEYYDQGHSYDDLQEKFGMARGSISKAAKRGDFVPRAKSSYKDTLEEKTKEEAIGSGNYQTVRKHARMVMENDPRPKKCESCGWSYHADVCHIRPVSEFSDSTLLKEINDPSNLIYLCPNCHWLFDKGHLKF